MLYLAGVRGSPGSFVKWLLSQTGKDPRGLAMAHWAPPPQTLPLSVGSMSLNILRHLREINVKLWKSP